MCGIAGIVTKDPERAEMLCVEACSSLEHRGPDDDGWQVIHSGEFSVGLAQARLSIIDLSDGGHQPFCIGDSLALTFNGEIYNYLEIRSELESLGRAFLTGSDTEVLAQAWAQWGENCLLKLDGMFAFGVLDQAAKSLTLVRDAFGIKPMYYSIQDGDLVFSSTPDSIADFQGFDDEVDLQAAYTYLAFGQYDIGERTFFKNVSRLTPGSLLRIDLSGDRPEFEKSEWWSPEIRPRHLGFSDAVAEVREAFLSSVSLQMRSDVPIGFALSGGVDSSAIVCSARTQVPSAELKAFGYVANDERVSEEKWIKIAADQTSSQLIEVTFPDNQLEVDFPLMAKMQGEPFSSSRIYAQYKVFEAARRSGVKVVLEGQGGDELFAGYHGFAHLRLISLFERGKFLEMLKFLSAWRQWPGRSVVGLLAQAANLVFRINRLPARLQLLARQSVSGEEALKVLQLREAKKLGLNLKTAYQHRLHKGFRGRRVIEGLIDALRFSYIPQLVRQGDRNAMAHSVENRVPFLSIPLAEKVLSLPEEYLISSSGETKSVLKAAMRGIVPDELLNRRDKVGFETPQDRLWRSKPLLDAADAIYRDKPELMPFVKWVDPSSIKNVALKWRYLNLAFWLNQRLELRGR